MIKADRWLESADNASITYETALVLPLFVGILVFFLSIYQLMTIQEVLSSAAYYAAEETSLYGFIFQNDSNEETDNIEFSDNESSERFQQFLIMNLQQIAGRTAGSVYFTYRIGLMIDENQINEQFIKNGIKGISFYGSDVLADDRVIIKMKYSFRIPIFEKLIPPIEASQSIIVRSYTGHYVPKKGSEAKDEDEKVYITETGQVYHTNRDCTYIKLSISEASHTDIHSIRSKNGGKYYECSICKEEKVTSNKVYITDYGDRYHVTLKCSGIKRSVTVIKLSEAEGRRLCSKCSSKEETK